MFTVMTWNLENFERPAANASEADRDRYASKLKQISELITGAGPDLVGVQEVLAGSSDLGPAVFDDLLAALGAQWNGCLSQRPDERGIRVGWLSRGQLTSPTDVADYPPGVPATTVDDQRRSAEPAAKPDQADGWDIYIAVSEDSVRTRWLASRGLRCPDT